MTTPTSPPKSRVDAERLRHLVAWAESEDAKARAGLPSEWNQGIWSNACGTACCIAGKVALEDGGKPIAIARPCTNATVVSSFRMPDGSEVDTSIYAQSALGLGDHQAEALFESSNDLDRVRRLVDDIIEGREVYTSDEEDW